MSSLPTDPSILAQELASGTTGIPALDQSQGTAPNPGFQRAALLLIGPTVGATPQFAGTLYQAIALLPGVTALGPTTTHDGETGQEFAAGPGSGQSTIVVDPSTGQLLEVRGIDEADSISSIAPNYPNYADGGPIDINEYTAQLQWLDPIGSPSVVNLSQLHLPAGSPVYVFATTRAGLSFQDASSLVQNLSLPYVSSFKFPPEGVMTGPLNPNSPGLFHWSFAGPGPVVDQFIQTLRASGLFASVSEI